MPDWVLMQTIRYIPRRHSSPVNLSPTVNINILLMSGCLYTSPRLAAHSSGLLGHILIFLLLSSVATAEVLLLPITWLVGWCFSVMNLAESKKLLFYHLHTHCTCHKMYWRCNISWSYPYPGVCTFYMQGDICTVCSERCPGSWVQTRFHNHREGPF